MRLARGCFEARAACHRARAAAAAAARRPAAVVGPGCFAAAVCAAARGLRVAAAADGLARNGAGASARGLRVGALTAAADEPAAAADEPSEAPPAARLGKRKVALLVGYDGAAFRGLQMQPHLTLPGAEAAAADSVEDALLAAIAASGGALPANARSLGRLGWSRSSRTDKRVHSLATVVGVKLECAADAHERDPGGAALAAGLNAHLPPTVRVFAVQKVNGAFDARADCVRRSYEYYLPAALLGLVPPPGGGPLAPADAEKLRLLGEAWAAYKGFRPFHNYTKRRIYRGAGTYGARGRGRGGRGGRGARGRARDAEAEADGGEEEEEEEEEEEDGEEEREAPAAEADAAEPEAANSGAASDAAAAEPVARGRLELRWNAERDEADPVTRRHFRHIEAAACSAPELVTLVPGGRPAIRLTVKGGSFMLHQIRHMVGAAVLVALGRLSPALHAASLEAPARVGPLPLAPPVSLVLADAEFRPFRLRGDGAPVDAVRTTGAQLGVPPDADARRRAFDADVLRPALDAALGSEEWESWRAEVLRFWHDPAEAAVVEAEHAAFLSRRAARRAEREAEVAAEAAAEAAAEPVDVAAAHEG
jgi:tRNA pseudouridine38-40 synthase